jgi:hypothetical protein
MSTYKISININYMSEQEIFISFQNAAFINIFLSTNNIKSIFFFFLFYLVDI